MIEDTDDGISRMYHYTNTRFWVLEELGRTGAVVYVNTTTDNNSGNMQHIGSAKTLKKAKKIVESIVKNIDKHGWLGKDCLPFFNCEKS